MLHIVRTENHLVQFTLMNLPRLIVLLIFLSAPALSIGEEDKNVDPFESFNRPMFAFNDGVDKYFLRPIAAGYDFVMPDFAQTGVGNFFANLLDANAAVNSVLQGKFGGAARGTGRFLVNSTFGILGLVDVATPMGIDKYTTDFGHTLAIWGVPSGPYIMVPLMGPRTLRSGAGSAVDAFASLTQAIDHVPTLNTVRAVDLVDVRAGLLRVDDLISGDRYIFLRDAYLQQRNQLTGDGTVDDSFSDFEEADWDEDF
ncbi:MAG: phospholipid-binding lipoprotein MlaA [Halioglobus sp.]